MPASFSLPAVLLWRQPWKPASEKKDEEMKKTEGKTNEEEELLEPAKKEGEAANKINLCTDISFWCWLFGTTFWSLGENKNFLKNIGFFTLTFQTL